MTVEDLTEALERWAEGEPEVRAVALVGSHARGHARSDSDVDLVVLASTDWATPPIDARTAAVIRDGLVAVWDPDSWFARAVHAVAPGGE